jgi:selenide,water dikinase
MIGPETLDDAGVYRLDEETALIQTVDFFTPLVDDPYDFGAIAAANSLSDVYAMGGTPISALAVLCFPVGKSPLEVMKSILLGGMEKVKEAGAAVAGGHSVVDVEMKFGFAVTGLVHPSKVVRVSGALPGDALVLTKPLGTGVLAHTLKAEGLSADVNRALVESMKELNAQAASAMVRIGVHACTDVTGFGLLGHALNMAERGGVCAAINGDSVPALPQAAEAAARKMIPGGLKRNRRYVSKCLETSADEATLDLLCDPQTSGGLLMAVAPDRAEALLAELVSRGVRNAALIGEVLERSGPHLLVR